jgi:O-antigen ligase
LLAGFVIANVFSRTAWLSAIVILMCICFGLLICKINNRVKVLLLIAGLLISIGFGTYSMKAVEVTARDVEEILQDVTGGNRLPTWSICSTSRAVTSTAFIE